MFDMVLDMEVVIIFFFLEIIVSYWVEFYVGDIIYKEVMLVKCDLSCVV